MKLLLNFTQRFQLENSVPETSLVSNLIPEIQDKKNCKKSIRVIINQFITKMSPTHWFNSVWDDLNFNF